jgi:hypothetical protein
VNTMNRTSVDDTLIFVRIYIFSRYIYLIVFGLGLIGNTLNLIVFSSKTFRSNSCSIYFIAYSLNNYLVLSIGLLIRSLTNGFLLPLENHILIWCKIRRYLTHVNYLLSSFLLTMASINRYARVRQAQLTKNNHYYVLLCEHRTTWIIIALLIVFCLLINLHIPFLFEIDQGECYARPGLYRYLFDIFFFILYGLCPIIIMIIVNVATIAKIRHIRRLVHPTVSRGEYYFIGLVIAHSIFNAVLTLPYVINKFVYYTFQSASPTEIAKLVGTIVHLAFFMNHGVSFFLYTLTTATFRRELIRAFHDFVARMNIKGIWVNRRQSNVDRTKRRDTIISILSLTFPSWTRSDQSS